MHIHKAIQFTHEQTDEGYVPMATCWHKHKGTLHVHKRYKVTHASFQRLMKLFKDAPMERKHWKFAGYDVVSTVRNF